jgi:hypothetical protein
MSERIHFYNTIHISDTQKRIMGQHPLVSAFETNTCLSVPGEYGKNLTPRGSAVNVTHTSVSRLVLLNSLEGDSAQQLIQKVRRLFSTVVTTLVFS